ncbi:MAG TPA: YoaK family protein [Pseudobdellovibrionaceae bacterium]|nr:YoaK family protein [Pseudobdellovibrionaceae bacterium]
MFRHRVSDQLDLRTVAHWLLLCFVAGNVNSGGYLACHRFVSHVTGFATLAGIEAAEMRWLDALGVITVPIYFLFGVMISAYFVDRRLHEGRSPRYALVMGLASLCLFVSAGVGVAGWWGEFGHSLVISRDYFLLALLCMASGLQNAALTSSSGSTLRTTHLTGATTDLGIGLVRWWALPSQDARRETEKRVAVLRLGSILSFMLGSTVGAFVYLRWQYAGFFLPALLGLYVTSIAARQPPLEASTSKT